MPAKILFVDDDELLLQTYQRHLRKLYDAEVALGAEEALAAVADRGPFAVIVSDMRMPGMNGIQLLAKVREIVPDTVRMMLSGHGDLNSAIEAVNEGNVFRFLTKPCSQATLLKALDAGLAQYRLVTAERELLSETLSGSLKVLSARGSAPAARTDAAERLKQYLQDIEAIGDASRVPRYRSPRHPYGTTQWVAPYFGDTPPERPEFHQVGCRDLSTSGLSFFWPQPFDYEHVVVRLGAGANVIHVTARVVRTEPVDGDSGPVHLVGCEFTRRVLYPGHPST